LPSLLLTTQRQEHHPLEFFRILLTADTAEAQAALFNDSPEPPPPSDAVAETSKND